MKKIPSLFKRDYEGTRLVYNEVVEGCEWVQSGEGVATIKFDGTACLIRSGLLYKRYDAKKGKQPPEGFIPAQPDPDPITEHYPGWIKVEDGPDDQWHRAAYLYNAAHSTVIDGTYELIGPKVQGNPYHLDYHALIKHGSAWDLDNEIPRDFDGLREWFAQHEVEGIVWWRDLDDLDCDKVKIKRKDFGLSWPIKEDV